MAEASRNKTTEAELSDIQRDIEELKKSISALVNDVGTAASNAQGRVGEKVSELGNDLRKRGEYASNSAQNYVREHPLQSIAIAFGVGMLAARLTTKR